MLFRPFDEGNDGHGEQNYRGEEDGGRRAVREKAVCRIRQQKGKRRLNARVKNVSMCVALTLGIAGLLVFGLGMAMILEWGILVGGVAVAAVGALPMAGAAPAYNLVLRHEKQKYGPEIVRLSEELLGEEA